jgi:hypothetical protein
MYGPQREKYKPFKIQGRGKEEKKWSNIRIY